MVDRRAEAGIIPVRHAGVAQLAERLTCNQQVGGSSPSTSSREPSDDVVGWPSGQRQQTVNLPASAYVGSNPTPTTISFGADLAQQVE